MPAGVFTTPRPVPGRLIPSLAGGTVLALALPVFLVTGWRLAGWTLGFVLFAGSQLFAFLLARAGGSSGNLAAAGVLGFGMMFRAVAVMVALIAAAASDARLALAGALVYALAYTTELALSLIAYFGGPR